MPKNFVEEPFTVSLISSMERFYASESYVTIFCRIFFLLTVPKNAVGKPFSLSLISGIEKVWMRGRGGGVSRFSVENFLSHSAQKFRRGTLLISFRKFLVAKILWIRGGREYQDFPSKNFCLTVPKNFVEEPVCVSENFGYRKSLCLRGEYHDFL